MFLKGLSDEELAECEITTKVGRRLVDPEKLEEELKNPEVFGQEPDSSWSGPQGAIFHGLENKAQVVDYSKAGIARCLKESKERLQIENRKVALFFSPSNF